MSGKLLAIIISGTIGAVGYWLLWQYAGGFVALGVFLVSWMHSLDHHIIDRYPRPSPPGEQIWNLYRQINKDSTP